MYYFCVFYISFQKDTIKISYSIKVACKKITYNSTKNIDMIIMRQIIQSKPTFFIQNKIFNKKVK